MKLLKKNVASVAFLSLGELGQTDYLVAKQVRFSHGSLQNSLDFLIVYVCFSAQYMIWTTMWSLMVFISP